MQITYRGFSACDVCKGNVITFNPSCACSIASNVAHDPSPSRIIKCCFVSKLPLDTKLLEKLKNYLNKNVVIQAYHVYP